MSATTFGYQGLEAVQNKDWAGAIPLLDKALESSNSPAWLLARAHSHYQLKNYDAALHDAELAYHVAAERGSGNSRKQMIEAQYRRATIYFRLARFADADCCAKWSMLLAEGKPAREVDGVEKMVDEAGNYAVTYEDAVADKEGQPGNDMPAGVKHGGVKTGFEREWNRAYAWRSQVLGTLKGLPADHAGWKVNVSKIPPKPEKKKVEKKPAPEPESGDSDDSDLEVAKPVEKATPVPSSVSEEKLKLRADFYQSGHNVTVSLFAKDVNKNEFQAKFTSKQVLIGPIHREAAPYVKPGDRESSSTLILEGSIIPSESRFSVTPRKIELVLKKAQPGVKWGKWGVEVIGSTDFLAEEEESTAAQHARPVVHDTPALKENAKPKPTGPVYPTSSKSGPKDWEKLGEGEDDDEEKQDVNYFFKNLYKGAAPEQQRAMMKSFIESNGTALSTDWNDVGSRTVETNPPEGVEAKKWDQ